MLNTMVRSIIRGAVANDYLTPLASLGNNVGAANVWMTSLCCRIVIAKKMLHTMPARSLPTLKPAFSSSLPVMARLPIRVCAPVCLTLKHRDYPQ
jgi:hypothetical protein